MTQTPSPDILKPDMIDNPRLFRLNVRIGSATDPRADFAVYSPNIDNSLIYKSVACDVADGYLTESSLRDAIYNNPLLLCDFQKISVLIESPEYMIVPEPLAADSELVERLLRERFDSIKSDAAVIVNPLPGLNAAIVFAVDPAIYNLINRAFNNPPVYSHFYPLLVYFASLRRTGNRGASFINVRPGSLDIILFKDDTLDTVRLIPFRSINDAIYYALTYQAMTPDNLKGRILVSGERDTRMQLVAGLKQFVDSVMPVIFPSAIFKLGRTSMDEPFDLSIMPLCE